MKQPLTEKQIENAILEYLYLTPGVYWKNNTVGIWDSAKRCYRKPTKHTRSGVSDIIGLRNGRAIFIEVKTAKGRLSDKQKEFLSDVNNNGGLGFVARSVEDVRERLSKEFT